MNFSYSNYQEQEFDYKVDDERDGTKQKASRQRRGAQYARANRPAVTSHNGIHRRRNKRFAW